MTKKANQVSKFVHPDSEHLAEYGLNRYQLHPPEGPHRM